MLILKALGLQKNWHGHLVFKNVDLEIHQGERVALIGCNGVGKTTLLGCLLGQFSADGGSIYRSLPVARWGIVQQHLIVEQALTLKDFIQSGHKVLYQLKKELTQLENVMSSKGDEGKGQEKLTAVLARYGAMMERYQVLGGYQWEHEVESILNRFDLPAQNLYWELSGGQKTKAQLARVIAGNPSFLLLDEPTNHLDYATLHWLMGWARTFPGTVLFVSHDREFIDQVATKTVELTSNGTKTYPGNYANFICQRRREQKEQASLYKKQQQEKKKLEEAISRYRQWFAQAHRAAGERNPFLKKRAEKNRNRFKAKEKALEHLNREQIKRPEQTPSIKVDFKAGVFKAHHFLQVENLSFSYDQKPVLQDINLTIARGDRLAVVGPNGSGKTTLLQLLSAKRQPQAGAVVHHPKLKIGYFAQELENLNQEQTILDSLLGLPGMTQREARNILASFLFREDDVFRKIGTLSMGERCRVAFVTLYFSAANLIILDEPTNYLDISTREQMEQALVCYPGALVVVSHDRYLLKKVANRVAYLKEGGLTYYPGHFEDFQLHVKQSAGGITDLNKENQLLALRLQLAQLIAAEEPEEKEDKKAFYALIRKVKSEINKLE